MAKYIKENKKKDGKEQQKEQRNRIGWWLMRTPGWGAVKLRQLYQWAGEPERILTELRAITMEKPLALWYGSLQETWYTRAKDGQGEELRISCKDMERLWIHQKQYEDSLREWEYWKKQGMKLILSWEEEYPRRLQPYPDRPFGLFVRGNLPGEEEATAAVIGARACSDYGAAMGRRMAKELAAAGVQIISGLAYGIDSEGHWGALEAGRNGSTYAVLGCSVERCYPPEHEKLAERILAAGGGLISEFPPGTEPKAGHFPMRNRIISGLSDCVLVMEARKKSGSLITVDQALDQGKEVFALPGRVGDRLSEGCHQLIQNGAQILTGSGDVLEYLKVDRRFAGRQGAMIFTDAGEVMAAADSEEGRILDALATGGKGVEELMALTGLSLSQLQQKLLPLLMTDQVREYPKGIYTTF